MKYWSDYPRERIAKNNPYKCCAYCKVSDPAINGSLENHMEWCEYRQRKLREEELELLKLEVECLKIDAQKPVYRVVHGCVDFGEAPTEDLDSLEIFRDEVQALEYKAKLEAEKDFDPSYDYITVLRKFVR